MFQKLREWLWLKNYQYQVITGIYMLEPWERTIFNATLVTILGMSVYSTYAYLPAYIYNVLAYFGYVEDS
ncbi:Serine palmitoyltransferase small subunit A [Stylophora pistillata]|uniref:Serine palmitoyltransferase small subunit A n=1 Tax=Stylophora pistillata TaxID=50429 RepID=A0A2B4SLB4_STYPI|nr:Serine palmitoyltransferase small subunit A [Stylophora pistillata]